MVIGGTPPQINYKKTMVFIDGSNLLIGLSKEFNIKFDAVKPPFGIIELANKLLSDVWKDFKYDLIRKYWFASYQGDDAYYEQYALELRKYGFEPILFQNKRKCKEKGVDIALATEMLVNAFNQNYDIGFLVAGDKDYEKLVTEVKRFGPIINGAFIPNGLSSDLKIAEDEYIDILENVKFDRKIEPWKNYLCDIQKNCNK